MPHVNLLHEIEVVGRGTRALAIIALLAAFGALALAATAYDIGRWLSIW